MSLRPSEGKILDRICVLQPENTTENIDPDWFLVELSNSITTIDFHPTLVLVKLKNKLESLIHEEYVECHLKLLKNGYLLQGNRIDASQLKYCGEVRLSLTSLPTFVMA